MARWGGWRGGGEGARAGGQRAREERQRQQRRKREAEGPKRRRPFLSVALSARCGAQERKGEVEQRGLQVIPELAMLYAGEGLRRVGSLRISHLPRSLVC